MPGELTLPTSALTAGVAVHRTYELDDAQRQSSFANNNPGETNFQRSFWRF
jgi:hypothetical protein